MHRSQPTIFVSMNNVCSEKDGAVNNSRHNVDDLFHLFF